MVSNAVGVATSDVATLTVNAPEPTPPGIVLDDPFDDLDRLTGPISVSNSVWYASTATSLVEMPGSLYATNITSSRLWLGYFTENPVLPVDLAVGNAIKVTLEFTPYNVATYAGSTSRGLRVGLFDYADGADRLAADGFSTSGSNGANVLGYMFNLSFYTAFSTDTPIEIRARTSTADSNLIGTTGVYTLLGSGPAGYQDQPGYQSGVPYTLEILITRTSLNEMQVACHIVGGGLDLLYSVTDAEYPVNRFDAMAIRANNMSNAAEAFDFRRLTVEVVEVAVEPTPFPITGAQRVGADGLGITWESEPGRTYEVQSRTALTAGDWVSGPPVVAGATSQSYTNNGISGADSQFYRVIVP